MPLAIFQRLLGDGSSGGKVRRIRFDSVHTRVLWEYQDQSRGDECFEFVKGILLLFLPSPSCLLLGEVKERLSVKGELLYESPVEVGESDESLYFFEIFWSWPVVMIQLLTLLELRS